MGGALAVGDLAAVGSFRLAPGEYEPPPIASDDAFVTGEALVFNGGLYKIS